MAAPRSARSLSALRPALSPTIRAQQGGSECTTDWECSLGGRCVSSDAAQHMTRSNPASDARPRGRCACDAWFTGGDCSLLNLEPAASPESAGLQVPGYHSWGGRCTYDGATGKYVGAFSMMVGGCSLNQWQWGSAIVVAEADAPEGPYSLIGEPPSSLAPEGAALPPWAHNAFLSFDPASGRHLLFHIGAEHRLPANKFCNRSDPRRFRPSAWVPANARRRLVQPRQRGGTLDYLSDPIFVSSAPSPRGPWEVPGRRVELSGPADSWVRRVSNPGPFIFPNGTVLLYTSADPCPPGWGRAPTCIALFRAPSWEGPYTLLSTSAPLVRPESEDPFVFRDPRGSFHMLTNVNTFHRRCDAGAACGGHAWSLDGLTWSGQAIGAFGPTVELANGSSFTNAYAERPLVYQDALGAPVALFVGMGRSVYADSISWAWRFAGSRPLAQGASPAQALAHKQNERTKAQDAHKWTK